MIELYQFELSQYSEKVRLILDYRAAYRKIEVTPELAGGLIRISGQRKVPVLKDGNQIIADSTEIAKYLDRQYPNRPLFQQIRSKGGLLWKEWADESIGVKVEGTV